MQVSWQSYGALQEKSNTPEQIPKELSEKQIFLIAYS